MAIFDFSAEGTPLDAIDSKWRGQQHFSANQDAAMWADDTTCEVKIAKSSRVFWLVTAQARFPSGESFTTRVDAPWGLAETAEALERLAFEIRQMHLYGAASQDDQPPEAE